MFSIFSYQNNSSGIFDKFILFIFISVFILSILVSLLFLNNESIIDVIDIIAELLIFGRFVYDSKFKFIYLIGYNFVTRGTALMLSIIFSIAISDNNDSYPYLFSSIFLIFFNTYFFQFFKLKSYKACENSFELLKGDHGK